MTYKTFVEHITATTGIATEDMAVIAQSVGAVLIATWAHDYAPPIRGMVLASPAFKVKLYVPFARAGLRRAAQFSWDVLRKLVCEPGFLTHDLDASLLQDGSTDHPGNRREHPARAL